MSQCMHCASALSFQHSWPSAVTISHPLIQKIKVEITQCGQLSIEITWWINARDINTILCYDVPDNLYKATRICCKNITLTPVPPISTSLNSKQYNEPNSLYSIEQICPHNAIPAVCTVFVQSWKYDEFKGVLNAHWTHYPLNWKPLIFTKLNASYSFPILLMHENIVTSQWLANFWGTFVLSLSYELGKVPTFFHGL